jgi:hypothetical protein
LPMLADCSSDHGAATSRVGTRVLLPDKAGHPTGRGASLERPVEDCGWLLSDTLVHVAPIGDAGRAPGSTARVPPSPPIHAYTGHTGHEPIELSWERAACLAANLAAAGVRGWGRGKTTCGCAGLCG